MSSKTHRIVQTAGGGWSARARPLILGFTLMIILAACSVRRIAINSLGDALARGTSTYARDDDPELVRQAIPFGLKTVEALLQESPRHKGLLLAAASGFTQYSYAFVECEADYVEDRDLAQATEMRRRARGLYLRALEYGLRGLEIDHPGFRTKLRGSTEAALSEMRRGDVPMLYWTAAAWGAAMSIAKEDAELTADLSLAGAIMQRALDLDEAFAAGSLHDFFISYEGGRPSAGGGSVEAARRHLERTRQISRNRRAAPLVTFAETVTVSEQNRAEFERLLNEALAISPDADPEQRLANIVAQKRARWLLARADSLFVE